MMTERKFGIIFAICAGIFIASVSYFGGMLPVPKNFVVGQAMVFDDDNSSQ